MFKNKHNKNEKGQGLVEYALILVLVSIVVIAAATVLGPQIGGVFSDINTAMGGGSGEESIVAKPEPTAEPTAIPTAVIITGNAARAQYCAERPGYVGGVNWGASTHTWTTAGQTYSVTGSWNCPFP